MDQHEESLPSQPTLSEAAGGISAPASRTQPSFAQIEPQPQLTPEPPKQATSPGDGLRWVLIGNDGLRAGWSIAIFIAVLMALLFGIGAAMAKLHLTGVKGHFSPQAALLGELGGFLAMLGAAWVVSLVERRRIMDYNLCGPGRVSRFFNGVVAGFAALSLLIAALAAGGWLHFGPVALSGTQIFTYAGLWAIAFLLVGCVEEGTMRCFLLFTLARGINFWWAVGLVGAMCVDVAIRSRGNGVWGVYAMALVGAAPCLVLFLRKTPGAGFWYATWVTSTFFGYGHTGNNGENWIGIFAAGAVGAMFCASVKITGSAWWAIGCHASWDWAETYFYGTADSGMVAQGHYLSTTPTGSVFWSGGSDGPEGSVLVLGAILLLLAAVYAMYGRRKPVEAAAPALELPAS